MKLVHSSTPGAVERDQAIRLLLDRAVLTRMICRELMERDPTDRRLRSALFLLLRWIAETQGAHVKVEPRADDGLAQMVVPDGYADLWSEIKAGAKVCNALFVLYTADTDPQLARDKATIAARLADYRELYPVQDRGQRTDGGVTVRLSGGLARTSPGRRRPTTSAQVMAQKSAFAAVVRF